MSETRTVYRASFEAEPESEQPLRHRFNSRCAAPKRAPRLATRVVCEKASGWPLRADGTVMEKVLHAAWRRAGLNGSSVRGRDGRRYNVIYPGRPGGSSGPDFRDAILQKDDGTRIHGDIEVHVRSSEWKAHGHSGDKQYNGVVFHVTSEDDISGVATRSRLSIPLLALDQRHVHAEPRDQAMTQSHLPIPLLNMEEAGLERFRNKSHGIRIAIDAAGRDQAIWEAALETLGYPSNKRGFVQLARRMDWETVSTLASLLTEDELESTFMWAAGIGPKPRSAPSLKANAPQWATRHGRPANHPTKRISAAVAWALMWKSAGPAHAISDATRSAKCAAELSAVLRCQPRGTQVAGLGVSRSRETVVNVILPAAHALAEIEGSESGSGRAIKLYRSHPKTQRNSIEAEAATLLRRRGVNYIPRNACEQQGLIHIYRLMTSPTRPDRQLPLL